MPLVMRWRSVAGPLVRWAPLLVLALALGLRLYGLDWDQGHLFHPDERAVLWCVSDLGRPGVPREQRFCGRPNAPWDPDWFPYGSLPLYLLKGVQLAWRPLGQLSMADLRLPARAINAVADSLTALAVVWLGARLLGRPVGLLAGLLTALAVLPIQLAHFYTVDTLLALWCTLALGAMALVARGGGLGASALAGLFTGLALSTKVSAAPLAFPLLVAHLLAPAGGKRRGPQALAGLATAGLVALLAFGLTSPYAVLDWRAFLRDLREQTAMARRLVDLPYTRQYIGTTPYLYHVAQLTKFGLGWPLGVAAWGGLALALGAVALGLARAARRGWRGVVGALAERWGLVLLLAWVVPYFALVGGMPVKFMRYLLPILPPLLLLGAWALWQGVVWARAHRPSLRPWAWGALALVVAWAVVYALAYLQVYRQPHPAVRASRWLHGNAPAGSVVLKEHWEESLPGLGRYRVLEMPMYDPDTPQKALLLARRLAEADYIVFYSHRLYATIPRLPGRYPISTRYYRLLFSGRLGYQLVHFESAVPRLWGIAFADAPLARAGLPVPRPLAEWRPALFTFNLGPADESFTVYDHPLVLVFRRTGQVTPREALDLLTGPQEEGATPPLSLPPERWAYQQGQGTWADIAPLGGWPSRWPVGVWLLAVYAVSLVTLPLGLLAFRPLYDRGYLLARPLGLLLASYLPWLWASLGWAPFYRPSIETALALLLALGALLAWALRRELGPFLRERWRLLALEEGLFLVAFLSFLVVRGANPDLWHPFRGGEKPMDLAYLNAVVRSAFMPPYDPWFARGYINYYYFGQVMVGTLVKLTGIPTTIAYNLAVPLFFALTTGASFSLAFNLARGLPALGGGHPLRRPLVAGLAGALFVAVLGNLDGGAQLLQGAWEALARGNPFPPFDYWRSSRLMPPDPPGFEITEFPFFTFLFADLHAHLMALPLTVSALGLGYSALLQGVRRAPWGGRAAVLGLLALALGGLRATNTWDFPTYLALGAAALAVGEYLGRGSIRPGVVLWAGGLAAAVVLASHLLFLPYLQHYRSFYSGLVPSKTQTALWQYLGVHGLFVFALVGLLAVEGKRHGWPQALEGLGRNPVGLLAVALMASGLVALALTGYLTVALLLLALVAAGWLGLAVLLRGGEEAPHLSFLLLMAGASLALGAGVDLVTVKGDIGRMNTVFKFYIQAWVLLALASAVALHRLGWGRAVRPRWGRALWGTALALLLASSLVYPVLGTRARLADRFQPLPWTLDGTAYMRYALYSDEKGTVRLEWDREAIEWMLENLKGTPVVMEGVTPIYHWGSRVSVYTGLPAVVGWEWHQTQQRLAFKQQVQARIRDVDTFYATTDPRIALAILRGYGVRYVYLGETERLYYPTGVGKFRRMEGVSLRPVYRNPGAVLYEVVAR